MKKRNGLSITNCVGKAGLPDRAIKKAVAAAASVPTSSTKLCEKRLSYYESRIA